jgi:hypothetical protein
MPRRKRMAVDAARKRRDRRPAQMDMSLRRLRARDDTAYLAANPEMAARLKRALGDSLAGRAHEFTLEELPARYARGPEA